VVRQGTDRSLLIASAYGGQHVLLKAALGRKSDGRILPPTARAGFAFPTSIDEFGRSVRTWRIETRGSHSAMGVVPICSSKGKCSLGPTGTTYYLPFVLTITEVPYPFPTYP